MSENIIDSSLEYDKEVADKHQQLRDVLNNDLSAAVSSLETAIEVMNGEFELKQTINSEDLQKHTKSIEPLLDDLKKSLTVFHSLAPVKLASNTINALTIANDISEAARKGENTDALWKDLGKIAFTSFTTSVAIGLAGVAIGSFATVGAPAITVAVTLGFVANRVNNGAGWVYDEFIRLIEDDQKAIASPLPIGENTSIELETVHLFSDEQGGFISVDSNTWFTKYGLIDGKLITVSNDAVPDEKLGLRYLANVEIEKDWMQVDNRKVNLAPGMSVAVEIKTGQRRLIEYFLSPLLRFKQESIRER